MRGMVEGFISATRPTRRRWAAKEHDYGQRASRTPRADSASAGDRAADARRRYALARAGQPAGADDTAAAARLAQSLRDQGLEISFRPGAVVGDDLRRGDRAHAQALLV